MGIALDDLKLAGRDTWRDSNDWIVVKDKHPDLSFSGGQWTQKKLRMEGQLILERQYLLVVDRTTRPLPSFVWYTREAAYAAADIADVEIREYPHETDRLAGKTPEQIAAFFEKNNYKNERCK